MDMMTEFLMLAIRSNAFETRLITMIALLLECRELSVLSLTPPRISESDGTKKSLEVMTVTGRALMDTDGLLLPVILSALMTMTSLMLTQQSLTSFLNLSQGRPSHDGFGFYKSALFAGLSGR